MKFEKVKITSALLWMLREVVQDGLLFRIGDVDLDEELDFFGDVELLHADRSELSDDEAIRAEGVLAAHREETIELRRDDDDYLSDVKQRFARTISRRK